MPAVRLVPTRDSGEIRAFEPRFDSYPGRRAAYHCRGRVLLDQPARHGGGMTRQCNATLEGTETFCGRCGGLIAWEGSVVYQGVTLRHLERLAIR